MVIDKEERGFSPSVQFGQPEHLIAEVYRSVVALYLRLPAYEHVKVLISILIINLNKCPDGFLFSVAAQRTFSCNS